MKFYIAEILLILLILIFADMQIQNVFAGKWTKELWISSPAHKHITILT